MLDTTTTLSSDLRKLVETHSDDQTPNQFAHPIEKWREQWEEIIDSKLIEWGKDPSALADPGEGIVAPSLQSIKIASEVAQSARDAGWPPPTRVVPDGEGGIAFERQSGGVFESLEVTANGIVELLKFIDCRLVDRISMR